MPADGAFLVLVLLLGLAAPLVLYALVRAEHGRREEMDREAAERYARRDTCERRRGGDRRGGSDGRGRRDEE